MLNYRIMLTEESIRQQLEPHIQIQKLQWIDESELHAGHKGQRAHGGGHYVLKIISPDFANQPRLKRHRQINSLLKEHFQTRIHALRLELLAPGE